MFKPGFISPSNFSYLLFPPAFNSPAPSGIAFATPFLPAPPVSLPFLDLTFFFLDPSSTSLRICSCISSMLDCNAFSFAFRSSSEFSSAESLDSTLDEDELSFAYEFVPALLLLLVSCRRRKCQFCYYESTFKMIYLTEFSWNFSLAVSIYKVSRHMCTRR